MTQEDHSTGDPRAAFDELGRMVLADQSMDTVLQRVAELAKQTVPGAAEVSVSFVSKDGATTPAFTGELARDLDESQYERGYGPCLDAAATQQTMHISDVATETRWAGYVADAAKLGALSSLSVPVPMPDPVSAALNIYARTPHAFDDPGSQATASTFAAYAGAALANMHLYDTTRRLAEQMETAMRSRAVIDQAKGILMAQRRCSPDEAFEVLVQLSQRSNRKLREVAQALVDRAVSG